MATILMIGLDGAKHNGLRVALQSLGHRLVIGESTVLSSVDVVFCDGDRKDYRSILSSLKAMQPALPVVLVSASREDSQWVCAAEAGGSAWCCAPFSGAKVRRILLGLPEVQDRPEVQARFATA